MACGEAARKARGAVACHTGMATFEEATISGKS